MTTKFYWHIYHDRLLDVLVGPLEGRIKYIREEKPAHEVELRLRLLRPVRGKLPAELVEAGEAYAEARKAYAEARKAYYEAWRAYLAVLGASREELEALHKEECPDCPWDGTTIFPERSKEGAAD